MMIESILLSVVCCLIERRKVKISEPSYGALKSSLRPVTLYIDPSSSENRYIVASVPRDLISTRRMAGIICSWQKGVMSWIIKSVWHDQKVRWVHTKSQQKVVIHSSLMVTIIHTFRVLDTPTSFKTRTEIGGHSSWQYVLKPTESHR